MPDIITIVNLLVAYLLGSMPFAVIIAKIAGIGDVTKFGSGNPGATNITRMGGKKLGAITLILDGLKGFIAGYFFGVWGGLAAIIGHCFPIWLKFKGGKGVATAIGAYLAINPLFGGVTISIWLIMFALFRISSLSALTALNLVPYFALFYLHDKTLGFVSLALGVFIAWRHKSNIKKLIEGTEN